MPSARPRRGALSDGGHGPSPSSSRRRLAASVSRRPAAAAARARGRSRLRARRRRGSASGRASSAEDRPHHPLHLPLLGPAVAADRLLDVGRRVLSARDAGRRGGDEHGSPRLTDGERDAGVCPHDRLLDGDGVRRVLRKERLHSVEDRQEPQRRRSPAARPPAAVGELPDAPVACVDDAVPACCRPWIDAENLHGEKVGTASDAASVAAGGSSTARRPGAAALVSGRASSARI